MFETLFPNLSGVQSTPYFNLMNQPAPSMASIMAQPQMSSGFFPPSMNSAPVIDLSTNATPATLNALKGGSGLFDNFFGKTENGVTTQGWGGMALGGASALMNGILGFKQLGLARDTLANNKRQFELNFDAQRKTTNSRLADRQANRIASNPNGGFASVSEYMAKYGI